MTSKERMMRALRREKPDRLPVTVHQWQGYHLDHYLGGISDLEAFKIFGMDAQVLGNVIGEEIAVYRRISDRREVHDLFTTYGQGGGYIISTSDHFFDAPLENLKAYADAARECVY